MSADFYKKIKPLKKLLEITDFDQYKEAPDDWYAVITDVKGSTKAIDEGRYKDVNMFAACSIAAVLNIDRTLDIPFIFGGDGTSIVFPPTILNEVKKALLGTRQIGMKAFGLDMRMGIVPIIDIKRAGYSVKVSKLQLAPHFAQAVFTGGGLTYAEAVVKDPEHGHKYILVDNGIQYGANFDGLECRWQDIPSKHGETISLLIKATDKSTESQTYEQVINTIERIYGDAFARHPVHADQLQLSLNPSKLKLEASIKSALNSPLSKYFTILRMQAEVLYADVAMFLGAKQTGVDWSSYKDDVATATDNEKFDDILRMIVAGTTEQRAQLQDYLKELHSTVTIVYGIHVSDRALMTCLVFERNGRQVHFIDGADGGYALAAKQLKSQLKNISS